MWREFPFVERKVYNPTDISFAKIQGIVWSLLWCVPPKDNVYSYATEEGGGLWFPRVDKAQNELLMV